MRTVSFLTEVVEDYVIGETGEFEILNSLLKSGFVFGIN